MLTGGRDDGADRLGVEAERPRVGVAPWHADRCRPDGAVLGDVDDECAAVDDGRFLAVRADDVGVVRDPGGDEDRARRRATRRSGGGSGRRGRPARRNPGSTSASASGFCRRRASCSSVGAGSGGWCRTTTVPCGASSGPLWASSARTVRRCSSVVSLSSPYPAPGTLVSTVTIRRPATTDCPETGTVGGGTPSCASAPCRPGPGRARSPGPAGSPRAGRGCRGP